MFVELAMKLSQVSPWFKRLLWQRWYQYLAGYQREDWRFMNYGYAPVDDSLQPLVLDPDDESDRYAIQLYDRVAGAVPLQGLDVLEVGCGRGGGSSFVKRYHCPKRLTGVDFSAKAVGFCQENHEMEGLSFVHGDAENLPFDDESFDAVINVESSHCYGSMSAFLHQVHRVLRCGGHFLFADLRGADDCDLLDRQLLETGMTVLKKKDITSHVLEALRKDSARKLDLIQTLVHKRLVGTFRRFAAIEGSDVFDGFRNGAAKYVCYSLRKQLV